MLNELYQRYGSYGTRLLSFAFEGSAGFTRMQELMDGLRKAPPEELAGIRVEAAKDYSLGVDGLPKSNVLRYFLAGGMEAVIRPSGTEPKLKVYLTTVGESREKCTAAAEELENWFEEWAKQ